ncbi:MAG: hypothetical protein EA423_12665, partial [Phycisphaerales bacterium]
MFGLFAELGIVAGAITAAVVIHWLVYRLVRRLADNPETQVADEVARRLRGPTLILVVVLAFRLTRPARNVPTELAEVVRQVMSIAIIVLIGWTLIVMIGAASKAMT